MTSLLRDKVQGPRSKLEAAHTLLKSLSLYLGVCVFLEPASGTRRTLDGHIIGPLRGFGSKPDLTLRMGKLAV